MSDNTFIRFTGGFDKTIPDFFEEVWSLVAHSDNERDCAYFQLEPGEGHQYYEQRGSTEITAWSWLNTNPEILDRTRTIKIEYEDNECNYYQMVIHHDSKDGKYRLAMPLVPTLEGPFDE